MINKIVFSLTTGLKIVSRLTRSNFRNRQGRSPDDYILD